MVVISAEEMSLIGASIEMQKNSYSIANIYTQVFLSEVFSIFSGHIIIIFNKEYLESLHIEYVQYKYINK